MLTQMPQLTFAFRLILRVLWGMVHVGIINGFSGHGLKSGNKARELVPIVLSCAVWDLTLLDAPHCFSVTTLAWLLPSPKVLPRIKLLCISLDLCDFLLQHLINTLSQNTSLIQITAELICCPEITLHSFSFQNHRPNHYRLQFLSPFFAS